MKRGVVWCLIFWDFVFRNFAYPRVRFVWGLCFCCGGRYCIALLNSNRHEAAKLFGWGLFKKIISNLNLIKLIKSSSVLSRDGREIRGHI
jgi:hypothetical protein